MKSVNIKKNHVFTRIYKKGRFTAAKHIVLYMMANKYGINRIGFTAGLKCGNSVRRNRLKRLMRESFRLKEDQLKKGHDLIISAKPTEKLPSYEEIDKELRSLLKKMNLYEDTEGNKCKVTDLQKE